MPWRRTLNTLFHLSGTGGIILTSAYRWRPTLLTLLLLTISLAAIAASIAASAHRPVPVVEALPVAALGLR